MFLLSSRMVAGHSGQVTWDESKERWPLVISEWGQNGDRMGFQYKGTLLYTFPS